MVVYALLKKGIGNSMDWMKKHVDTVIILGAFGASVLWMNGKFNDMDKRFSEIEKDIVTIKTVLIMKNIMPSQLARDKGE